MKKTDSLKSTLYLLTCTMIILAAFFSILYHRCHSGWMLSAAITFGTISYHFIMRLCVGYAFQIFMKNKADHTRRWYRIHPIENHIYNKLHVKKWKNHMPTFDSALFDPQKHTWEEIVGAMCQAELVHETIMLLSFLPIIAGRWFGAYIVFIIMSIFAAAFDLCFVIIQRYNRPRVVKIMLRQHAERQK